jgi:hypothetical protein
MWDILTRRSKVTNLEPGPLQPSVTYVKSRSMASISSELASLHYVNFFPATVGFMFYIYSGLSYKNCFREVGVAERGNQSGSHLIGHFC